MSTSFSAAAVIPYYNHPHTVGAMVEGVLAAGLPCLVVDDGSAPDAALALDTVAAQWPDRVSVVRLAVNQGKGGAMMAGFAAAELAGYSHVLQIDADGQHAVADIPAFMALARSHPGSMICGAPSYDASVPKRRLYGRYATHVWVWINTLSLDIQDSMCGFRVYPLARVMEVIRSAQIGKRMEFDTEVLVRMHWQGVPFVTQRTAVTYPQDGISHFRVWRDNVLISRMHAGLFAGMLLRSPRLLARKLLGSRRSAV